MFYESDDHIAELRLSDVRSSKVDDDWRTAPVPQNDIPDVNGIVQDAVLGLDSTERLHDLAGDPLCFSHRDVNASLELRPANTGDTLENGSLNDAGDRMKGSRLGGDTKTNDAEKTRNVLALQSVQNRYAVSSLLWFDSL